MINAVTVTNHLGEAIKLELRGPNTTGLLIQDIEGLGPAKANINMNELATIDGAIFNSSKVTTRNIVFTFSLAFAPTIEDARLRSYRYFPIKKPVTLLFETDNRTVETVGYVESNDPVIFDKETTTQISIICPDPYFYSAGSGISVIFSGTAPEFEFPFCNNSLSEALLECGDIKDESSQTIAYSGDADAGMVITIHALGTATDVTIYNVNTRETMFIDTTKLATQTGSGIVAGDDIIISTISGNKYAYLLRGGVYTNIINCLAQNSDWFKLVRGDNVFVYVAATGEDNLEFKMEYKMTFEGV